MPISVPEISLAGGVLSPETYARIDLQKFGTGAKRMDNFFVHAEGGVSNRAGKEFIHETKDSSGIARDINFEFNEEQTYALEFGNLYMRVIQDGALVLNSTSQTITGATAADPVVITSTNSYSNGDEVFIQSVEGMTELNNRYFIVANVTGTTYELTDITGADIDGTSFTAYTSGGTGNTVFELVTPYADTDLALLKYRQSNDVLYLTHRSYAPRKLGRTDHDAWTLTEMVFAPVQDFPTGLSVSASTTGSVTTKYKVTAVAEETAEESLVGTGTTHAITGATAADPVVLTLTAHPYENGDEIHVSGISGMTELNDRRFIIANQTTNTVELSGEDGSGHTAYVSGGSADLTHIQVTNGVEASNNDITIPAATGAESYNIYKEDNGLYGFIGSTESGSFTDDNLGADLDDTAPKLRQPFKGTGNYPGAVGLHEQRSVWGNTTNDPLNVWLSQTSQFENLNVSSPTKETDAVTLRLVTGQGNEIRHFRSFVDQLFCFTSGVVWTIKPGGDVDAITPSSKKLAISDYISSTNTPPITIKKNILMVSGKQDVGFEVHSLGYKLEDDGYVGSDLTVLARHLFVGYTIKEWAYIERPYRLVAAVRSDGKMNVLTYLQEHQVFAWTVWETDGTYESVCSVSEGQEDALYVIVKRTINGRTVRYQERLHSRTFSRIEDAFFVDCGLSYISEEKVITGATAANPVVITSTSHGYSNGNSIEINDVTGMTELNGNHYTVANVTSNTYELSGVDGSAYTAYTSGGTSVLEIQTITNMGHLEGRTDVIALVNGNLETGLTITNGSTTLTNKGSKIHIGLPYTANLESLPINPSGATLDKKKAIKSLSVHVNETRALLAGSSENNLESLPARSTELWGEPAALRSDIVNLTITSDWSRGAGVHVQSVPGLPLSILALVPNTNVGG